MHHNGYIMETVSYEGWHFWAHYSRHCFCFSLNLDQALTNLNEQSGNTMRAATIRKLISKYFNEQLIKLSFPAKIPKTLLFQVLKSENFPFFLGLAL